MTPYEEKTWAFRLTRAILGWNMESAILDQSD